MVSQEPGTVNIMLGEYMGESFQEYSWIQDFEADFTQKVSPKKLN